MPSRKHLLILAGLLLVPVRSARAEIPDYLQGRQIVEVDVLGEGAAAGAYRDVGIPVGALLTRSLIRGVILRLMLSGHWADVQIDAQPAQDGVRLLVRLTPRFVITRIELVGNRALDEPTLRDATGVETGVSMSNLDLEAISSRVRDAYAQRGYLSARIKSLLFDTGDLSQKVLMIRIDEGPATRITGIEFRGQQPPDPAGLLSAMRLKVGDLLDRRLVADKVERGQKRLLDQGYLECNLRSPVTIIEKSGARLVIPSSIGPRYQVAIRGYWPLERSDVYEVLELDRRRLSEPGEKNNLAARVTDLYARYGYADARVEVRREPGPRPDRAILAIDIYTGNQLRIVEVTFPGAEHFSRSYLLDQLNSYLEEELPGSSVVTAVDSKVADDIGFGAAQRARREVRPAPLTDPRGIYYRPIYDKAVAHIVERYQSDGFLSARVGPPLVRPLDGSRAEVSIPVQEGPRTRLYEVVISGNSLLGTRELLTESGLQRDAPFSYLGLEKARLSMIDMYQERGYLYAKVEPAVRFSRDRTLAEVTIQIVEGFPVHVDNIVVRGARRTSESIIRALVQFETGDLYRPSLARESEEKLLALGIFTSAKVAPQDPELPARLKPLVVTVTERDTHAVELSAGISTAQGARAGAEYGYRDLFGQAVNLTLRAQVSYQLFLLTEKEVRERFEKYLNNPKYTPARRLEKQLARRITLDVNIPYISGLADLRTNVDLMHMRDNERDFGLVENAASLTFTYPLARRLSISVGGDAELNNLELFVEQLEDLDEILAENPDDAPRLRKLLLVPQNDTTLYTGRTALSWDERDNPFVPTRGFFATLSAELSGMPGSAEMKTGDTSTKWTSRFVKLMLGGSGYIPVGARVVLAGQARVGGIVHLTHNSETYPTHAFFLGGVDTIRGYFQDSMMPQDKAEEIRRKSRDPNKVVRSADAFILLRGEVRFPIFGQLQGGLFTDLGNLWADPFHRSGSSYTVNPLQLRPSAGAGIRLNTPVGPLALDYGILLLRRRWLDEPFGTLHFSIGLF